MTTHGPFTFDTRDGDDARRFLYSSPYTVEDSLPATSGTPREWCYSDDNVWSFEHGPTSGAGGDPDGYIYTEARGAIKHDEFTLEFNTTLDASLEQWQFNFKTNQRGSDNSTFGMIYISENGGAWRQVGAIFAGGKALDPANSVNTDKPQIWAPRSYDLSEGGVYKNSSTRVKMVLFIDAFADFDNADLGIDDISFVGTRLPNQNLIMSNSELFNIAESYNSFTSLGRISNEIIHTLESVNISRSVNRINNEIIDTLESVNISRSVNRINNDIIHIIESINPLKSFSRINNEILHIIESINPLKSFSRINNEILGFFESSNHVRPLRVINNEIIHVMECNRFVMSLVRFVNEILHVPEKQTNKNDFYKIINENVDLVERIILTRVLVRIKLYILEIAEYDKNFRVLIIAKKLKNSFNFLFNSKGDFPT